MSTKLTNSIQQDAEVLEVRIKGPGAVTVGLYDSKANALMTKRLVLHGPAEVEARSRLPLALHTTIGHVQLVPVLIHQTSSSQVVTFAGQDPAKATADRSRALKLNKSSMGKIQAASQLAARRISETGTSLPPPR